MSSEDSVAVAFQVERDFVLRGVVKPGATAWLEDVIASGDTKDVTGFTVLEVQLDGRRAPSVGARVQLRCSRSVALDLYTDGAGNTARLTLPFKLVGLEMWDVGVDLPAERASEVIVLVHGQQFVTTYRANLEGCVGGFSDKQPGYSGKAAL